MSKKTAVDAANAALVAIDAVVRDELAGADPGRYMRVAKICSIADKMRSMYVTSVGDVNPDDVRAQQQAGDYVGAPGYDMPVAEDDLDDDLTLRPGQALPFRLRNLVGNAPLGHGAMGMPTPQDMIRMAADISKRQEKSAHEKLTARLDMLSSVRDRLSQDDIFDLTVIDRQIGEVLSLLDKESVHADPTLVRPELLRGHQPRAARRPELPDEQDQPDAAGEGRALGAGEGGREEEVADRLGVATADHGADADEVSGADRQGGQGPGEGPQADASDHHGGEVFRRDDGGASWLAVPRPQWDDRH